MATDPFTLVHDALWAALEANSDFTDAVPEQNRIKFSGNDRSPVKDRITSADTPDVRIVMQSLAARETGVSNGEFDRVRFLIELATGDQRLDARAFPIVWAIRQAIYSADEAMAAVEFNAKTGWILSPHTGIIDFSISDDVTNRGIIGWAAIIGVEFQLIFSKVPDLTA
jgi:hypothetical protein